MPRPSAGCVGPPPEDHRPGAVAEQHQQMPEAGVPLELLRRQRAGIAAVQHLEVRPENGISEVCTSVPTSSMVLAMPPRISASTICSP